MNKLIKNKYFLLNSIYCIFLMSSIFDKLKVILYENFSFHYEQIQYETKLELELGMDSRELFELLEKLEQIFNFIVDFNEIDYLIKNNKILTIEDIVSYIQFKQSGQENFKFSLPINHD